MHVIVVVVLCVPIVAAWDWAGVSRVGSMMTTFDYQYWPLSKLRLGSLVLLMLAASAVGLSSPEKNLSLMDVPLDLAVVALIIWGIVAWLDLMAQRRLGRRELPRSSDRGL